MPAVGRCTHCAVSGSENSSKDDQEDSNFHQHQIAPGLSILQVPERYMTLECAFH